ncbi:MAG TPA: fibronectin type III domain-containing protein [Candidatus Treponema faecavium]|nr:fibronectin type III domain-containing protein [Candidatus Treponema faecavium]
MLLAIFGCQNHLLPPPTVPVTDSTENAAHAGSAETWGAPAGITATHGLKRSVQLSWQTVPAAVRYYIYEAATPYDEFVQIAETSGTQTSYTVTKDAGADSYYRVKAVNRTGELSPFSQTVRGTSLAQPVISDIIGDADNGDTSVIVYWYMNNVSEQTYLSQVQYTIICQDESGTEIARTAVSGAQTAKTEALFAGLTPNTSYKYKVEAFITSAQQDIEESAFMDAATARRLRPLAVTDLAASQGSVKDRVTLTFTLPDMVDTQDGEEFVQTPLYFMIYRREKAAEGAPAADFTDGLICAKFAKEDFGGGAYTPGQTVSYEDTNITRGIEYEYLVQSYSDTERPATSDRSAAQTAAPGWALSTPVFAVDTPQYVLSDTPNADEEPQYKSATVHMTFAFDPKGIDYTYILNTKREPVGDGSGPTDTETTPQPKTLAELADYTTDSIMLPNYRGKYFYWVEIQKDGQTIDTASMIGTLRITEETKPLIIEDFSAEDGYSDKLVLTWKRYANVGYKIEITEDETAQSGWNKIEQVAPEASDSADSAGEPYTCDIAAESGKAYYVRITPYKITDSGSEKYGMESVSQKLLTLGTPVLEEPETRYAYDGIQLAWQPVQKADAYRVVYEYTDVQDLPAYGGTQQTALLTAADLEKTKTADGRYTYQFKPEGFDDACAAGRAVSVTLEAINTERCQTPAHPDSAADASAVTESAPQTRRQMGPGAVSLTADKAAAGDRITLSWNSVEGAAGYLIYRIQYDMDGRTIVSDMTAPTAVRYMTESRETLGLGLQSVGGMWDNADVSGMFDIKEAGTRFTLTDTAASKDKAEELHAAGYRGRFIQEQYDMPRGYPYAYIVIPVLDEDSAAEFDEDAETCAIGGASYKNVQQAADTGYALGLPQSVRASKGWGRTDDESSVNDCIEITWEPPEWQPDGKTLTYDIYRKEGTAEWKPLIENISDSVYNDATAAPGIQYAYAVRTKVAGAESILPHEHVTVSGAYTGYMDAVLAQYEPDIQGQQLYQGYMLGQPKVTSVSRGEQTRGTEYAETVSWSTKGLDSLPIAGYRIEVYNTNIDDRWHAVMDVEAESTGGAASKVLSAQVTNSDRADGETEENLLKVLRDYKHYFRMRTYTENEDGEPVYSKEPEWTWTDGYENDYVRWGARQITAEEFARAATLAMAIGIRGAVENQGIAWTGGQSGSIRENTPGSGSASIETKGGFFSHVSSNVVFDSYMPVLNTKANTSVTFLTISGQLYGDTESAVGTSAPKVWNTTSDTIVITGPDIPSGNTNEQTLDYSGELYLDNIRTDSTDKLVVTYNDTRQGTLPTSGNCAIPFKDTGWNDTSEPWL